MYPVSLSTELAENPYFSIDLVVKAGGVIRVSRFEVADTTDASLPQTLTTLRDLSSVLKLDPEIVKVEPPAKDDTIFADAVRELGNSILTSPNEADENVGYPLFEFSK